MPTDSKALFLGLTGAQRFAILKERERALAVAREQACRATYKTNAEKPVPVGLVQWGKNLRRGQSNLIAQLITYIDNGAERNLIPETWHGLDQMVGAVYNYARARMPIPAPQVLPSGKSRAWIAGERRQA